MTMDGLRVPEGMTPERLTWPASTWEDCARHIEAGGVVQVETATTGWMDDETTAGDYRRRWASPGTHGIARRRLVPIPAPAPESSPDGEGEGAELQELREKVAFLRHGADRLTRDELIQRITAIGQAEWSNKWWSHQQSEQFAKGRESMRPENAALAAKLAAYPEVPDGCELVMLPSAVRKFLDDNWHIYKRAPGDGISSQFYDEISAALKASRRPKPEPRTERDLLPIEVEADENDGGFVAKCAVPGVFGQGETIPEAVSDLVAAARAVEELVEDGES